MKIFDSLSGLVNSITGTGTVRDKMMASTWSFSRPSDSMLSNLYRANWMAGKIVDIPIEDMLREHWTWGSDHSEELNEAEEGMNIASKLDEVLKLDGVYGGAVWLMGTEEQDLSKEWLPEQVRRGDLRFINVLARPDITIGEIDKDPASPYFRRPKVYRLVNGNGAQLDIHPSRVIDFNAYPSLHLQNAGSDEVWGDSRLARVIREINATAAGVSGMGRLLDELAVSVYKFDGLSETLAERGGVEKVRNTLNSLEMLKSSLNAVAINKEDELNIFAANLSGLPDSIRSLLQLVAGASDIPLTRFLGNSPDGMNSTGEGDIRNYYDRLKSERKRLIEDKLRHFDKYFLPSVLGTYDASVRRTFPPLWQMTEQQQAEHDGKVLDNLKKVDDMMAVPESVTQKVVRQLMIDSEAFPGAAEAFDDADAAGEEPPDPAEIAAATAAAMAEAKGEAPGNVPPKPRVVGGRDMGDEQRLPFIPDGWTVEDVKAYMSQPRHPSGSSKGGQWSGGASARNYGPQMPGGWSPRSAGTGSSGLDYDVVGLSDTWSSHKPNNTTKLFEAAGVSPRQLVEGLLPEGSFQDSKGVEVKISASKGGSQVVNVRVGKMGDPVEVHRMFYTDGSGRLVASHERLVFSESTQGKGLAKSALAKSMDLYEKAGVDRVETVASLSAGGYVWAKFGFVPANETSWSTVKRSVKENLMIREGKDLKKEWEKDGGPLDLYNSNPKDVWKISDHPRGKEALKGSSWSAQLDLKDDEAMARFNKYTGRSQ